MISERKQKLINKLNDSRQRLNTALDAVGDRWDEQLYSEGAQWTIRQLLTHLMLADAGHVRMVKAIAAGIEFIPADYDIDRYNKGSVQKNKNLTIEDCRQGLANSREEALSWIDEIDDSVLDIEGRHASLNILSIEKIFKIMALHEISHAQDIETHLNLA